MNTSRSFNRISSLLSTSETVESEEHHSPESLRRLRLPSTAPIEVIIDSSHHSRTASSSTTSKHNSAAEIDVDISACKSSSSNNVHSTNGALNDAKICHNAAEHKNDNSHESKTTTGEYIINTNDDEDDDVADDQSLGDHLALHNIDSDKSVGSADRSAGVPTQVHVAAQRRSSCTGAYMRNTYGTRSNPSLSSSAHYIVMSPSMSSLRSLNLRDDGSSSTGAPTAKVEMPRRGRRPSIRRRHSIASAISTANLSAEERLEQNSIDSLPYSRRGSLSSVVTEIHPLSIGEDFVMSDSESDDDSIDSDDGF